MHGRVSSSIDITHVHHRFHVRGQIDWALRLFPTVRVPQVPVAVAITCAAQRNIYARGVARNGVVSSVDCCVVHVLVVNVVNRFIFFRGTKWDQQIKIKCKQ